MVFKIAVARLQFLAFLLMTESDNVFISEAFEMHAIQSGNRANYLF